MSAFDTFQVLSSKANRNWADKPWEQQRFLESGNTLLVHQNSFYENSALVSFNLRVMQRVGVALVNKLGIKADKENHAEATDVNKILQENRILLRTLGENPCGLLWRPSLVQ